MPWKHPACAWWTACSVWLAMAALASAEGPHFDREVAPLLAARCLECHSGPEPKGQLDLSRLQAARAGGESGPALVPGQPESSLLWQRIEANEMPPKHPLPAAERAVFKAWIRAGADWGTDPIDPYRYTTSTRAGYDWWSLQPLRKPAPPAVRDAAWPRNAIDLFILARLEAAGLAPSPAAEPRALVRRATFDLLGLPPSPEELADGPDYDRLIDRLLASPHYGERWARHWLDVAHFGESDGFEYDRMRPHAWRYRDWVIAALNRDLPYDEFARLQIAGDVLRPGEADALIATGFLVGGAHDSLFPKGELMQMIMRQDELEDLVGLVGQTFLGLTVHCARCHDHKFDPLRQADYYRLAAALAGVKRGNRSIPAEPPAEIVAAEKRAAAELAELTAAARASVLAARAYGKRPQPAPPQALARWEFDGTASDDELLPVTLHGPARIEAGGLVLDGQTAYAATAPLDRPLFEKTLEAWVQLASLEQRGGAAISIDSLDGKTFDALVFGEREPRRWIAGSNNFRRTQSIAGAPDEALARERAIHLAVVYHADGQIQLYRDGQPYGAAYASSGPVAFAPGTYRVLFGLRHAPPGGNKHLAGRIERARLYDRALTADEIAASAGSVDAGVSEAELLAALDAPDRQRYAALREELKRHRAALAEYRERQVFAVSPQPAPVVHVLARGNVQQPKEAVAAGGIACLAASGPEFGLAPDAPDAVRRTQLADWIASSRNPLFARTIVNRVWQYHFGRGLVETPNDLGRNGGEPSHPELLDWLAAELVEHGWSLKYLHRLIVTSAAYRQSARPRSECLSRDAENRLLWRYSPRRLEAECVRDAMLVAAGLLEGQMAGPSYLDFRPYMFKNAQYYEPLDLTTADAHRRSVYRFWARGGRNPLLDTFDCPDPSVTAPRRPSTTTPLQALALFNNAFTLRMADAFALRVARERPDDARAQVARAFEIAYGRPPSADEQAAALALVAQYGLAPLCRVLLNANGFLYVH